MKIKTLMKFYFSAGSLNRALDNIITRLALSSGQDVYAGCEEYFDKICRVLEDKQKLSELWARLDGVMSNMTERDRVTLKSYAAARTGVKGEIKKEIHRAAVKFARRAAGILKSCGEVYSVLCAYRCLISPSPE
ncbi:MAG: hypothetical protein K2K04_06920 [Clostridia bacterium]|nr:hypothetical protein [Clostridia bacterium]